MKTRKILITGASGLVGTKLTEMLLNRGYIVHAIGRKKAEDAKGLKHFVWDMAKQEMDSEALEGVSGIVHLAGAGVADERWSSSRKREIMESRTQSTALLFKYLRQNKRAVDVIVSASAVGYYGDCGADLVTEKRAPAHTFLAEVCKAWEEGVVKVKDLGVREVRCRIGIVLSENGGALPELTRTLPLGVAPYFSNQDLYYPWIHINDVCGIMIHALENEKVEGAYNTTTDTPVKIRDLMETIVSVKKSGAVLVPAPSLAIKIAMGEMSDMLLSSQRCSASKILKTGYRFAFPELRQALEDIYC